MKRIFCFAAATTVGVCLAACYGLLGFQSSWWRTFLSLNILTANAGGWAALSVADRTRKRREIPIQDVHRAIGAVSERYALSAHHSQVLTALAQVEQELTHGRF